ncbi:MAG: hypothetical protein GXO92_08350 [FCB group bacterium]|nr:hypothetical protein [FCB group bacterium]
MKVIYKRSLLMTVLILMSSGAAGQVTDNFLTVEKSTVETAADVDIYAATKADKPLSRYLYGKFTEHLGQNVYHGLWAQILINPSFEGWHFWGSKKDYKRRMSYYAEWVKIPKSDVIESYERGVAPFWMAYGEGDISYALDTSAAFNSETSQKITIRSLNTREAGIRQAMYLPVQRENNYEIKFYARSQRPTELTITISKFADNKRILSKNKVTITSTEWKRYTAELLIERKVEKGTLLQLYVGVSEPGTIWLDQMTLFPEDNVEGFDVDVVKYSKESKLTMLRFPGGNFVSGYHWKDGVGPIDKRKTTKNRPWSKIEYNHVGTDEYLAFCRIVGAEPLICVNAGDGTPQEAADWVEYVNGSVDTKYGALRAKNGHPEPYNVVYWEIGNELWGEWQIGYTTPEEYAERYEKFYKAMKAVDPTIKTIANGQYPKWNAPVIKRNPDILRSLSLHTVVAHRTPPDSDPKEVYESIMAYTSYYPTELKILADQMAEYIKEPKIAVTELQIFINDRNIPNNHSLSEAIFYSGIINASIRSNGLVELITHSALVNHAGGLIKYKEFVFPNPVYYARKLYSTQSGNFPVQVDLKSPMFTSTGRYSPVMEVPYMDAIGLLNDDGSELNLILTNRHPEKAIKTRIALHDFLPAEDVKMEILTGDSFLDRNRWENPFKVQLQYSDMQIDGSALSYTIPAHTIVLLTFERGK